MATNPIPALIRLRLRVQHGIGIGIVVRSSIVDTMVVFVLATTIRDDEIVQVGVDWQGSQR